jgi:hypothetical protein
MLYAHAAYAGMLHLRGISDIPDRIPDVRRYLSIARLTTIVLRLMTDAGGWGVVASALG